MGSGRWHVLSSPLVPIERVRSPLETPVSEVAQVYPIPESPCSQVAQRRGNLDKTSLGSLGVFSSSPSSSAVRPSTESGYNASNSSSVKADSVVSAVGHTDGWTVVTRGRKAVAKDLLRLVMIGVEPVTTSTFLAGLVPKDREVLERATRIQVLKQHDGVWRLDLHVERAKFESTLKVLRRLAYIRDYRRPKQFETYGIREKVGETIPNGMGKATSLPAKKTGAVAVCSWNIRGFSGQELPLLDMVGRLKPGILALQETLWTAGKGAMRIEGYTIYHQAMQREEAHSRGNALCVSNSLHSYPINLQSKFMVGAKIHIGEATWTVASVYLPSGGNCRSKRSSALKGIRKVLTALLKKEPTGRVVLLGDWNMLRGTVHGRFGKWRAPVSVVPFKGADWTRQTRTGKRSALDFLVASSGAAAKLSKSEVLRKWAGFSDHSPVRSFIRFRHDITHDKQSQQGIFDRSPTEAQISAFVSDNRWSVLAQEYESVQTTAAHGDFVHLTQAVGSDVGIRTEARDVVPKVHLSKREKRAVTRYRKLFAKLNASPEDEKVLKDFEEAKSNLKLLKHALTGKRKARDVKRLMTALAENDHRGIFKSVRGFTKGGELSMEPNALRVNGEVEFGAHNVARAFGTHYSSLANVPTGESEDEGHWQAVASDLEVLEELPDINLGLSWSEVCETLKECAPRKASGPDGIPVEILKLARNDEDSPGTPFAKAFFELLKLEFNKGLIGNAVDNLAVVRSIFKKGDSLDPGNYRGISLMGSVTKVLATLVARRLSKALVATNRITPLQAGFRAKEEGMAHVVALYELVRRRAIAGSPTYALFVDFAKAFDSVAHEALFVKLASIGVRGKTLEYIKALYRNSYAAAKVNGSLSEPFRIARGVRQGCPLSPILFVIFVNDLFDAARKDRLGAVAQGLEEPCPGLQFADDTVVLSSTVQELKRIVDSLERWTQKWNLSVNASKCGLMAFNGTKGNWEALREARVSMAGGEMPIVDSYKYLELGISSEFGKVDSARPDLVFALEQRMVVARAKLGSLRSFLTDYRIPVAVRVRVLNACVTPCLTYGGEWYGLYSQTERLDQVLVIGAKWILGSRSKNRTLQGDVLLDQLGIVKASVQCAILSIRAYLKYPTLESFASSILKTPFKGATKTWQTYLRWYSKTYLKVDPDGEAKFVMKEIREALKRKTSGRCSQTPVAYPMTPKQRKKSQTLMSRRHCGLKGEVWFHRYRLGGLWAYEQRVKSGQAEADPSRVGRCSACRKDLRKVAEWDHVIMQCPKYANLRKSYLPDWTYGNGDVTPEKISSLIRSKITSALPKPERKQQDLAVGFVPVRSTGNVGLRDSERDHGCVQLARFFSCAVPKHFALVFEGEDRRGSGLLSVTQSE